MVVRNDREQVWVPSDDDRPFVSIQVQPRPRADGTVVACEPSNHAQGTAKGGFYFVRKGDSVEMVTAPAPGGVVVSESRCIPPGEEALSCGANYADGQMPAEREARARAVCASLAVR